ncbi:hypothetical protein N7494_007865 [Penicillium frequentans]|uniref:Uncharacterized protein n=1 Tax=Penicillium frequentans TaxID=3151616 RepID=A0AAD6CW56_9EURO|nr:hypothetical protein N7494_007865 [Penicillium glabrum]
MASRLPAERHAVNLGESNSRKTISIGVNSFLHDVVQRGLGVLQAVTAAGREVVDKGECDSLQQLLPSRLRNTNATELAMPFAHRSGLKAVHKINRCGKFANIIGLSGIAIERSRNIHGESGACEGEKAEQIAELELHFDWYAWGTVGDIR